MKNLITKNKKDKIDLFCAKYEIENYSINSDGSIDVIGNVDLSNIESSKIPITFNNVSGYFTCAHGSLKSLINSPRHIGDYFGCSYNKLTSLVGGPLSASDYYCSGNDLTTLEGAPKTVIGNFDCEENALTSLIGGPETVGGYYDCSINKLETLTGMCHEVGEYFACTNNLLTTLVGGPNSVGGYYDCSSNHLTSLDGCAEYIKHNLNLEDNDIVNTISGNIDIITNSVSADEASTSSLPKLLLSNWDKIQLILKYQRPFMIWNDDLTLDVNNFQLLIDEINDGLL
jgi:hypothetical protein